MRQLHRELARGPLPGVVGAEVEIDGPPVVAAVDLGRDLDPLDRAALEGGAQHHRPDQGGVGLGQVLELGRVVLVDAVGLATRRQRRDPRGHGRPRLDAAVAAVLAREVLDQGRRPEPCARQQRPLPVAVQSHRRRVGRDVMGDVDAELLQALEVSRARDRHRLQRDPSGGRRYARGLEQVEAQLRGGLRPGAPAGLGDQLITGADGDRRLLDRAERGGRRGRLTAAQHGQVPVGAGACVEPGGQQPFRRRRPGSRGDPGRSGGQGTGRAVARHRAPGPQRLAGSRSHRPGQTEEAGAEHRPPGCAPANPHGYGEPTERPAAPR